MTTIGQNSPATPLPRTAAPSGVGRTPASRRIGASVPSDVVVSAIPSTHHLASRPSSWSTTPTARPTAAESSHPRVPRASDALGTRCSTTSSPTKKKSSPRPSVERNCRYGSTSAMPSTAGPMRMPSTISTTTVGSTIRRESRDSRAPRLDASRTSAKERRSGATTWATTAALSPRDQIPRICFFFASNSSSVMRPCPLSAASCWSSAA